MNMTLNGKLINATQCTNTAQSIPGAVRCTITEMMSSTGKYEKDLTPVPKGLEVFGITAIGVQVQDGKYQEMYQGDWYLIRPNETAGIVVSDQVFKYMFKDELGL
jgi:hypothetical protein